LNIYSYRGEIKMPARDRTGPRGEGPRTGRGFGDCDGATETRPFGFGRGCGGGRGRGYRFRTQVTNKE
jgi:hypothetical protein